jgi:hypothetical protein
MDVYCESGCNVRVLIEVQCIRSSRGKEQAVNVGQQIDALVPIEPTCPATQAATLVGFDQAVTNVR